jgi:hypothetical protein
MTTRVGRVRFHDGRSESEVFGPIVVALSAVCCSTVVDEVDGVRCHNSNFVGGRRFPW